MMGLSVETAAASDGVEEKLREGQGPHPTISRPPSGSKSEVPPAGKRPTCLELELAHRGLTMMATLENNIAERNCHTLGGCREESYSLTHHDPCSQPRPQGLLCAALT